MFAKQYLQRNSSKALIETPPDKDLGFVVVIPCFREPDILRTLESLKICYCPSRKLEVIVLINHSEVAKPEIQEFNQRTGLEFQNPVLLTRALTHRSYINENPHALEDNERLEFLGDAVLDFVVGAWL